MKLLEDGQVLEVEERNIVVVFSIDPSKLEGLVIDGAQVKFSENGFVALHRPFVGDHTFTMEIQLRECVQPSFLLKLKTAYMKCRFLFPHGNRAGSVSHELTTCNVKKRSQSIREEK